MHCFKDAGGRDWTVEVTVASIRRVRALLKIDLLALVKEGFKPLAELLSDPCALVDVLYVLCKVEADARQVSDEDFGRLMAGDVLEAATDAFLGSFADFFPDARLRSSLKETFRKGKKVRDLAATRLEKETTALSPEKIFDDLLRQAHLTSNGSAGSSLASAALTPDP